MSAAGVAPWPAHAAAVRYHGVDIAILAPVPNLIEMDIIEEPVGFRGQTFDVCAAR